MMRNSLLSSKRERENVSTKFHNNVHNIILSSVQLYCIVLYLLHNSTKYLLIIDTKYYTRNTANIKYSSMNFSLSFTIFFEFPVSLGVTSCLYSFICNYTLCYIHRMMRPEHFQFCLNIYNRMRQLFIYIITMASICMESLQI